MNPQDASRAVWQVLPGVGAALLLDVVVLAEELAAAADVEDAAAADDTETLEAAELAAADAEDAAAADAEEAAAADDAETDAADTDDAAADEAALELNDCGSQHASPTA